MENQIKKPYPIPNIGDVFYFHPQSYKLDGIKWNKPRNYVIVEYIGMEKIEYKSYLLKFQTHNGKILKIFKSSWENDFFGYCSFHPKTNIFSVYKHQMLEEFCELVFNERMRLPEDNDTVQFPFTGEISKEIKKRFFNFQKIK
jgi:hypothetical protein